MNNEATGHPVGRSPFDRASRCPRRLRRLIALPLLVLALAGNASECRALDAGTFGWRSKEASGARPLLAIWIREPDDTPAAELARRKQYFEELLFGRPPHGVYPDALRGLEPTIGGYYLDQSAGKFTWRRAGFIGPLNAPVNGKDASGIAHLALTTAARDGHFNFKDFDTNRDGRISPEELTILIVSNQPNGQANHFRGNRAFAVPGQNVMFAGGDGVVGEEAGLATPAHELFHTTGAIDLYGPWGQCYDMSRRLSLMASVGGSPGADPEFIVNIDPWHKMLAGWIEPRLVPIGQAGTAELAAQHRLLKDEPERKRPLLLYDPKKGRSEFFLLEYRTPFRLGYDNFVGTSGLVIWQIAYGNDGNPVHLTSERENCKHELVKVISVLVRGAPDWQQGISRAYTSANGDIPLKWMNGDDSRVRVRVAPHKPADSTISVSWTAPAALRFGATPQVGMER